MKNVDKLTDTLIHIEHVLEKNIPTGYHEIVQEYVKQQSAAVICSAIGIIFMLLLIFIMIKWYKNKMQDERLDDEDRDSCLMMTLFIVGILVIFILFIAGGLADALQRAIAPNWFILQKLLSK